MPCAIIVSARVPSYHPCVCARASGHFVRSRKVTFTVKLKSSMVRENGAVRMRSED